MGPSLWKLAWILFALMAVLPLTAHACSCFPAPSVADSLAELDSVFVGRVISKSATKMPVGNGDAWDAFAYTFEVERIWKGKVNSRLVIVSGAGGGDCGYHFVRGETYIVYAYTEEEAEDGRLHTNICTRTNTLAKASQDISELPAPAQTFVYVPTLAWWPLVIAISITFCSGIVATKMWIARKNRPSIPV